MNQHPYVVHPKSLLKGEQRIVGQVNDWLVSHLAIAFGLVWTIWIFISIPLLVLLFPPTIQNKVFYLASGWIQLWALPLFVYVGNKLQKSSDAQSDAIHQALTHIAIVSDDNFHLVGQVKELIEINNKLTTEIHNITTDKS